MIFSTVFIATFAVSQFICTVSGLAAGDKNAKALVNCMKATWEVNSADLEAKGGHWSSQEMLDESCTFVAVYGSCLLKSAHELSPPLPDVVLFNLALAWQHMVLSEKAGVCQFNLIDELKNKVLPSGILGRENLVNIEEDDYEECAGDAVRECAKYALSRFEQRADKNFLIQVKKYHSCYEDEAKTCNAKILHDFIAYWRANERHYQEGKGEFGKMVENIPGTQVEL